MAGLILGISMISIVSATSTTLLVNTLTGTIYSIGGYMKSITSYDQPGVSEVTKKIKSIDLEFALSVINELVKENNKKEASESVKNALYGVNEILEKIDDELKTINDGIKDHNDKYLSRWRSFNCEYSIKNLEEHKKILDKRYKMLMGLLQLENMKK